jgi:hypothetical protein
MNVQGHGLLNFEAEPDPEFLAHLEWQVRTAARREVRFAQPAPSRGWRRLRVAAVLVLALATGAGCVLGAQQLRQSREASLRAAQWNVRCELANARLRAATADRDEARARSEAGLVGVEEFAAAERERSRLEHARARLDNEAAEVGRTGREPSDLISAPLVGGRDFVRERLDVAAADARAEVETAEASMKIAEARNKAGVTSDAEVREARQRHKQALSRQRLVEGRLALRAAFLDGRSPPLKADLDDLRLGAECAAADRRDSLDAAHIALARAEALVSAGVISQQELRSAQRRVTESEAALRLAELELGILARDGAGSDSPDSKR